MLAFARHIRKLAVSRSIRGPATKTYALITQLRIAGNIIRLRRKFAIKPLVKGLSQFLAWQCQVPFKFCLIESNLHAFTYVLALSKESQ